MTQEKLNGDFRKYFLCGKKKEMKEKRTSLLPAFGLVSIVAAIM